MWRAERCSQFGDIISKSPVFDPQHTAFRTVTQYLTITAQRCPSWRREGVVPSVDNSEEVFAEEWGSA